MRFPVVLSLLLLASAACDLQPPPKQRAAPTEPAATPPTNMPPTPPPTLPVDAGVAPVADAPAAAVPVDAALPEVSSQCLAIGAHIADVLIREATDPAQKAALEQDKTKIVRRSAEGCTRDAWSAEAQACFLKAQTVDAMQVCGKNLKAPE